MKISITSDIHIDFWIGINMSQKNQEKRIHQLIEKVLPKEKSDTLIIAGDIGHYNHQNQLFFKIIKEYYKDVIWVHGNHDLYMVSGSVKNKFNVNSFERLENMIQLANEVDGVHYLNGNAVEIDGVKIGGCGMWYNYDYAEQVWGKTRYECEEMWDNYLNDANYIRVPSHGIRGQIDNVVYSAEQLELLKSIYLECNVIVTHVSPDWSHLINRWQIPETTFYLFDGSELLKNLDSTKMWIFGHTHDKYFYTHESGCTMICNPLDYAPQNWYNMNLDNKRFITMEVGALKSYDEVFKKDG